MTAKIDALRALKAAVAAGKAKRQMFAEAFPERGLTSPYWNAAMAYDGSLDAAKALHDAGLPGCWMRMSGPWPEDVGCAGIWTAKIYRKTGPGYVGKAASPARAWLITILAALIAQEEAP